MYHILQATIPYEGKAVAFVTNKATTKEAKQQFVNLILGDGFDVTSVVTLGIAKSIHYRPLKEYKAYNSLDPDDRREIPFKYPIYSSF